MTRIRILPEILSNKIAAGEVVERPASVVKELVENAIDAHSTRITVEIAKGGRSLIRVSDNGTGMSPDDALLALERYATSKIYEAPDLNAIATLGFRGEALPSIAAVSRFTLITNDQSGHSATRIHVEGGKIKQVDETGAPPGTMIAANQLFFNMPARRKFLKTISTEMGHIGDVVAAVALGWKDIQFRLFHNERMVRNWPAATNGFDRVVDVLGTELRSALYPVAFENAMLSISGWISDPGITRSSPQKLFIYINGRFIRDRGVSYAILDGYKGRLMKGRFPVGVLFLEMEPSEVDVNVHPTKHEVRFLRQKELYQAIKTAVAEAFPKPQWGGGSPQPSETPRVEDAVSGSREPFPFSDKSGQRQTQRLAFPEKREEKKAAGIKTGPENTLPGNKPLETQAPQPEKTRPPEQAPREQGTLWQQPVFSELSVIGQFHNTYIICESSEALYLIDQHAAHERVVYETLLKQRREASSMPVQHLVIPETLELNYRESAIITEMIPELEAMGIAIEPFGGNTFIIKSLPAMLSDQSARPLITEIAETAAEVGYTPGLDESIEQCLILMACHGAIRANQALSVKEIKALLAQLERCDNPYHCPHGRPTLVRWPLDALEKRFRRTV